MTQFVVDGADRTSGQPCSIRVKARSQATGETKAQARGMLVSHVHATQDTDIPYSNLWLAALILRVLGALMALPGLFMLPIGLLVWLETLISPDSLGNAGESAISLAVTLMGAGALIIGIFVIAFAEGCLAVRQIAINTEPA